MKIQSLGHVVLKVSNQERAEAFYQGILGLPVAARHPGLRMTFFSLGDHHDFAVAALGDNAPPAPPDTTGLAHVAFKIGHSIEELREARSRLQAAGIEVVARDHRITQSLYFKDPDGNTIELYVETSDIWKLQPEAVAYIAPLEL